MADFSFQNHGSIVLVEAHTPEAQEWALENISQEGFQPYFPERIIVEPRYCRDLIDGLEAEGFTLEVN